MLDLDVLKDTLVSQYRAAIAMLADGIAKFPEDQWLVPTHANAPWQVAYHTLFFTEYYSQLTHEDFTPWLTHGVPTQYDDGIPGPNDPNSALPLIPEPFTKQQVLSYAEYCMEAIKDAVAKMDLTSSESGFYWYKISKLEHQLVNIRHTQHGAAQLADRLRMASPEGEGAKWYGSYRKQEVAAHE